MSPAAGTDRAILRDAARLRDAYEQGWSQRRIGDVAGVTRATVVRALREHGIVRDDRDPRPVPAGREKADPTPPPAEHPVHSARRPEEVHEDFVAHRLAQLVGVDGMSTAEAAKAIGIGRAEASAVARAHGIERPMWRPAWRPTERGAGA